MFRNRRFFLTLAIACAAAVVPLSASAASGSGKTPSNLGTQPSQSPLAPVGGAPARGTIGLSVVINPYGCTGQSDYPHLSGHVPGSVTAEARTACTASPPFEYVQSTLYRQDCFFFACWWTQVGSDSSSSQYFGTVYAHPNHVCNGSSSHKYMIQSYHEIRGYDGVTYDAYTSNTNWVNCG